MFGYSYFQLLILYSPLPHYPHIRIRHKEELRLLGGHLWAFSNELLDLPKDIEAGTIVTLVRERDGSPIGNGFFHPNSLIAFRLLSRDANAEVDDDFFERRISEAANRRTLLRTRRNALRLVHGESDLLPGLIVDQYDRVLSYQIVSAGFERRKDLIVDILQKLFQP
ncbi:MAG TPA: class I SAM-dependent rRNA methyltransferase, partial [Candidatus Kapabacteria bacterium]|nr:class I SAM-dependent rRNA methyltransferase [Candidatus Kapabacteria bacterium]